jgi:hypothetical protein
MSKTSLNLQRHSEVFFSTVDLGSGQSAASMTPSNTWKLEVLAGFAATSSAATQDITSLETGDSPDRSQQRFNTAVNPVDWNFQVYLRPTGVNTGTTADGSWLLASASGNVKPVADWFMWQALVSNTAPAAATEQSVWESGGKLRTINVAAGVGSHSSRSNFTTAQENHLYFKLDNIVYQVSNATVNQATVDAGIEEIATVTWTGFGTTLKELVDSSRDNAISVFGGTLNSGSAVQANSNAASLTAAASYHPFNQMNVAATLGNASITTNSYIKNRLSAIEFKHAPSAGEAGVTYTFPVTALSFEYNNNIRYLTPEEITALNEPIAQHTGTRAVTGSATMYLRTGNGDSAQFLRNIVNDSRTQSAQTSNANLIIGGSTAPYVAFHLPATQFEFPQLAVEDVIATSVNFIGQELQATKGQGGEVTIIAAKYPSTVFDNYEDIVNFAVEPQTVFTDNAGVVSASFGEPIAVLKDPLGTVVAAQTSMASRPIYGRHPAAGIRNLFLNSAFAGFTAGAVAGGSTGVIQGVEVGRSATVNVPALEIVAVSDETIDIRIHGTNTTGATQFYNVRVSSGVQDIAAAPGDQIRHSAELQVLNDSGANTVSSVRLYAPWRDSGGASLSENSFNVVPTTTMTRFSGVGSAAPASTTQIRDRGIYISVADGRTVDYTLRISRLQIERGSTETAYQRTAATGFDVTEAGQRSVYYLQPDGIDDWMEFAAAFAPAGGYTVAAAIGGAFDPIFAATSTPTARYLVDGSGNVVYRANTTSNQISGAGGSSALQRHISLTRVETAAIGEVWVTGADVAVSIAGDLIPTNKIDALFRLTSNYGSGRFYAGVLIPSAITEQDRLELQQVLAEAAGITF